MDPAPTFEGVHGGHEHHTRVQTQVVVRSLVEESEEGDQGEVGRAQSRGGARRDPWAPAHGGARPKPACSGTLNSDSAAIAGLMEPAGADRAAQAETDIEGRFDAGHCVAEAVASTLTDPIVQGFATPDMVQPVVDMHGFGI